MVRSIPSWGFLSLSISGHPVLTVEELCSAHVFCEDCMKAWLGKGKACPICRVPIESDQLQRFAMVDPKTQLPAAAPARIVNNEPVPKSRREIQYNLIEPDLFESIQMMESHGSYGSKIQTLVRHLLYVQTADPGSKTIVFSAWADSLHSKSELVICFFGPEPAI